MIARLISGVIGLFMLSSALRWILDPASAAAGLSMTLVEGPGNTTMGMNTQIGVFTAFFFTAGLMACIGAYSNDYVWLLLGECKNVSNPSAFGISSHHYSSLLTRVFGNISQK